LITAYFSRRYYLKASEDLSQEAGNLKQLTTKLMLMMDDAGLIEVEWDEEGNPIRVVKLSGTLGARGGFSGNIQVGDEEPRSEGSQVSPKRQHLHCPNVWWTKG
jgi:hypothetical protein